MNHIHFGDCREGLRQMAAAGVKVQMCVTSPPYFGLRDYGRAGQIGLEQTPEQYIAELVEVFRAVREVLADDGTLWVNIGDSYCNTDKWGGGGGNTGKQTIAEDGTVPSWAVRQRKPKMEGIKPKDLIGIPWMLAFALRADGWYLRSDIIWHKPNPMPESVTDRPTKAHEYLFLLSKSPRYYYDLEAVKEDAVGNPSGNKERKQRPGADVLNIGAQAGSVPWAGGEKRNRRSVWSITTKPYKGAHFAVFPRDLVEPCILAGSRPGDVVLDPFMGSGTTAEVATLLGRHYAGCELNEDYKPLQDARIDAARAAVAAANETQAPIPQLDLFTAA